MGVVERLKRLSAAATERPWVVQKGEERGYHIKTRKTEARPTFVVVRAAREGMLTSGVVREYNADLIVAAVNALPLLLELEVMVGRHVEAKRKRHSLAELVAMAEDGRTDDWAIALSYEAMEAVWQQLQEEGNEAD